MNNIVGLASVVCFISLLFTIFVLFPLWGIEMWIEERNEPSQREKEEYNRIATAYNIPVEQVKASIDSSAIAEDMKVKKALDLVKEKAVIKKAKAKKATGKKAAPKATDEEPKAE